MSGPFQRSINTLAAASNASLLLLCLGCSSSGPPTHAVAGKIEAAGIDLAALSGHTVEIALQSDPQVRAAGQIEDDGTFVLQTLQDGRVREGAVAGTYNARIVLADDDLAKRSTAAKALHARYREFKSSGLFVIVPAAEVVALKVTRR